MRLPFVAIVALVLLVGSSSIAAAATDTDGDGLTDSFEVAYGLKPNSPDGDHDGLLDPAEDSDRDGLSNLAEQTFATTPSRPDSDGDGIGDAMEDANGDGVANWKQQDDRPVPNPTNPPLDDPNSDIACYWPGHGSTGNCVGDPSGSRSVAIYGDSHSGQWIAALQVVALRRHWSLAGYAYSACPSVHVPTQFRAAKCWAFRADSEKALRNKPPDLIVLANYSHYGFSPSEWKAGLRATLAALPKSSRVIVLADTPRFFNSPPACLQQHPGNVGACEIARSKAYQPGHDNVERSIVGVARFVSMNDWVCPYLLCSVVTGNFLMWRDGHHLSVAYAKQLAPALGHLLAAKMPPTK